MNRVLTVSQLNNYLKNVFDDELLIQNITVEGEIFECKFSGGNTYLTLKEDEYTLSCVKFGARYEFDVGDKVHVTGSMRFYPRGGKATFVITYASKVGLGELLVKFNELKDRLIKEGIFTNTKSLPPLIKRLAIVTSADGAVIHDFTETLSRNGCNYIDIDLFDVRVQGIDAEKSIARAVDFASGKDYDVLVVARGGGSGQDLSCFNTEAVARSIHSSALPTISAVGHEVDYTLCDFAASVRAGTPSIAAELIVRNNEAFVSRLYAALDKLRSRAEELYFGANDRAQRAYANMSSVGEGKVFELKSRCDARCFELYSEQSKRIAKTEAALKDRASRLYDEIRAKADSVERDLKVASAVLDRSSPLKILSEGYAKVLKDGKSLNSSEGVKEGDKLKIIMSGGNLNVNVLNKE